jgi:hypothetical protein
MPLHLENIGDESNIDDFENRRFYIQMFEMKLLGYILDEEDFEDPTINRTMVSTEVVASLLPSNVITDFAVSTNGVVFTFNFKPQSIHNLPLYHNMMLVLHKF